MYIGSFQAPGASGLLEVSGVGFKPRLVRIVTSGYDGTVPGTEADDTNSVIGYIVREPDGTVKQCTAYAKGDEGVATSLTGGASDLYCARVVSTTGATDLSVVSVNADGFTLDVNGSGTTRFQFVALSESDVDLVEIKDVTGASSVQFSFEPDAVNWLMGEADTNVMGTMTSAWTLGTHPTQPECFLGVEYHVTSKFLRLQDYNSGGGPGGTYILAYRTTTQWDTNRSLSTISGPVYTFSSALPGGVKTYAVAIKGGRWCVGESSTSVTGSATFGPGVSSEPTVTDQYGVLLTPELVLTEYASEADDNWSTGMALSTTNRRNSSSWRNSTTAGYRGMREDGVIATYTTAGALESSVDLSAFTAGGCTFVQDDAAGSAQLFNWTLFAAETATTAGRVFTGSVPNVPTNGSVYIALPVGEDWVVTNIASTQWVGTAPATCPNVDVFIATGGNSAEYIKANNAATDMWDSRMRVFVAAGSAVKLKNASASTATLAWSAIKIA